MIGPGWMPSRPRPLAKVRFYTRRPRARRARPAPHPTGADRRRSNARPEQDAPDRAVGFLRFDSARATLPVAMLRPRASQPWHRALAGELRGWLAQRWSWLRPRSVPMIVAFAGLLAVLGATKYLSVYACASDLPSDQTNSASAGATDAPADDLATQDPDAAQLAAPQLPNAGCDAVVQPLTDRWPGPERRLYLHAHAGRPAAGTLHRPDGCSLANARRR